MCCAYTCVGMYWLMLLLLTEQIYYTDQREIFSWPMVHFIRVTERHVFEVDATTSRCSGGYLVCRWTEPPWPQVGSSAAAPGIWNTSPSLWEWPPTAPAPRPDTARKCYSATGSGWSCPPRKGTTLSASCGPQLNSLILSEMSRSQAAHGCPVVWRLLGSPAPLTIASS